MCCPCTSHQILSLCSGMNRPVSFFAYVSGELELRNDVLSHLWSGFSES